MSAVPLPIPRAVKLSYTLLVLIVLPVYWYQYGPANFLWFSDIAFFVMAATLWLDNRFITSMMAIGVLPLEFLWLASLLSGGAFLGIANYMFDDSLPLWLRALSLFHFPMPAAIIYMLVRRGYDSRALYPQIILSLAVIAATHVFTIKSENVNMVFPPISVQPYISEKLYVVLMPFVLVGCIIMPMHMLLKKIARSPV